MAAPPPFDLDGLFAQDKKHKQESEALFNRVLRRAHDHVHAVNRINRRLRCAEFTVPLTLGLNAVDYHWRDCVRHLAQCLGENGFVVRLLAPNRLHLSWAHWISEDVRAEYQRTTGHRIDGRGQITVADKEPAAAAPASAAGGRPGRVKPISLLKAQPKLPDIYSDELLLELAQF